MGIDTEIQGKDWKEKAANWLFSQGFTGVLLIAIIAGCVYTANYQIPTYFRQFNETIEKVSDSNNKSAEKIATEHKETVKQIIEVLRRDK